MDVDDTPAPPQPTPRDRLRRLVPRSSRVRAALLVTAALLAFALAFALGDATADTSAPLRTAKPLVPRSQAVEIRGLPAARSLPLLRSRLEEESPMPVEIVGEG
jgi:hypothetical protein